MEYRNTKQRQRTLELLEATKTHPTATTLYDQLRGDFPKISLGTVYRNLAVLEEQGLLQKLDGGTASDRYDADTSKHIHFRCMSCDQLIDVADAATHKVLKNMMDNLELNVDSYSLMCMGICPACESKAN